MGKRAAKSDAKNKVLVQGHVSRRGFLRSLGLAGASLLSPLGSRVYAAPQDYVGRLFITVQADGGWDVTSFCDPKMNVPGENKINFWADNDETRVSGNIAYAPFADNQSFFEKYQNDMLVINGIDAQTNSHTTGVVHNWSGRVSEGYPSLAALFASIQAPQLPFSYISNGGYSATAKLINSTRFSNPRLLANILSPREFTWDHTRPWARPEEWAIINRAREVRLQRLIDERSALPRQRGNRQNALSALQQSEQLTDFANSLPADEDLKEVVLLPHSGVRSSAQRQIQLMLLAFQQGMACSGDVVMSGFDTHIDHSPQHEELLGELTNSIDYLWTYAEELGIANRLTVLINSDFGRTPHYNSSNFGKDHWPIGSAIVMERNAAWGNRVVGLTDEGHNALSINPSTLQRDDVNGTIIYPKHLHLAMRRYLGITDHAFTQTFPFNNTEEFDFFNPGLMTAGRLSDPRNTLRTV